MFDKADSGSKIELLFERSFERLRRIHTTADGHQWMFQELVSLETQRCPVWVYETLEPLNESGWSQAGPREGHGHWILD